MSWRGNAAPVFLVGRPEEGVGCKRSAGSRYNACTFPIEFDALAPPQEGGRAVCRVYNPDRSDQTAALRSGLPDRFDRKPMETD